MGNEKEIFRKLSFLDGVGRQMRGFDMGRPEYRGKMYVDAAIYGVRDCDRLTPEEADRELVSAYVCGGLERVELHLAMRNFENIDRNGREAGYDMNDLDVRKRIVRALVDRAAEREGIEPETKNIEWMNTYISSGIDGLRKALFGESHSD